MQALFSSLDSIIDLPYDAFQKKLDKLEEDFKQFSVTDISDDELEGYFIRVRSEYDSHTGELAMNRLAVISYLMGFDVLVEKYFPDYTGLFQASFDRIDFIEIKPVLETYLTHLDEILREYSFRLSDPDQYPSYTGFIQELIQNSMIDLFFWLQDQENALEKLGSPSDRNTDLAIIPSDQTRAPTLQFVRKCLEILGSGILEKIFFDLGYVVRVSTVDPELEMLGRYEKKLKEKK